MDLAPGRGSLPEVAGIVIRHVRQEDGSGCGVACLAMVTGKTYQAVKAWDGFSGKDFRGGGLTYHDAMQYLTDHGYATALRFKWLPGCSDTGHHTRTPWPTAPYAPSHLVSVQNGRHLVVLLPDGTVLDPAQAAAGGQLADVGWMLGVFDVRGMMSTNETAKPEATRVFSTVALGAWLRRHQEHGEVSGDGDVNTTMAFTCTCGDSLGVQRRG